MEKEIWKRLPEEFGFYEVSNYGNVRSLTRSWTAGKNEGHTITVKGKVLSPYKNKQGYILLSLNNVGYRKTWSVHQLVAIAFLNHNLTSRNIVIDHIDCDKSNNRLDNLQIVSIRDNIIKERLLDKSRLVGVHYNKRYKKYSALITKDSVRYFLGYFFTKEEAHNAYKLKEKELYGEK